MLRKTLCCLMCCIAILCLTVSSVFAENWFDGPVQNGSIYFDFNSSNIKVTGGSFELRMVAYWDEDADALRWCEGWEDCGLALDEDGLFADKNAASRLFVYAEVEGIPAQTIQVGADGTVKIENLPMGLYLVTQNVAFDGCMNMRAALISVPMYLNGEWVFDVVAAPKLEPLVPETSIPTTTGPGIIIPPTGQTNWPIPLLILGGCFLILLGLCVRKGKRHETTS